MDGVIEWLRDRSYYRDQIRTHRTVPGREGTHAHLSMNARLQRTLSERGISRLYRHQVDGIEAVRTGDNLVIATRTSSGKSLVYTVPAFERALDHDGRTLYIAPLRALINDQQETLTGFAEDIGKGVTVDQYTGQLSTQTKREVRAREPHIVLMTPDLLHYGALPHHGLWEWFFRTLDTVVIDEVHEYRGVFGNHISLLLRRLTRVCKEYGGTEPQFVCCSATIGNPAEHAGAVTGQSADSFTVLTDDTSETGSSNWLLWNPPKDRSGDADASPGGGAAEGGTPPNAVGGDMPSATDGGASAADGGGGERTSNHTESVRLFCDLLKKGYQTLVFTRTRQGAERYAEWCANRLHKRNDHELADAVCAYQAALPQERREEIEDGLHDGSVRGVWSTSALELGVDVGGLDVVIIDGYPGTRMQTHQRAGRAGRGRNDSLVILVGGNDQLDQYFMSHPDEFFEGDAEEAVVNPHNDQMVPDHVLSAAEEVPLSLHDKHHFGDEFTATVSDFETEGRLERDHGDRGVRWLYGGEGSPQHDMSIREIDDREITIYDRLGDETLGSLGFSDALRDLHPEAIYHHQGEKYSVEELDLDGDLAVLESTNAPYYTTSLTERDLTVVDDHEEKPLDCHPEVTVRFATIDHVEWVTEYLRTRRGNDEGEILPVPKSLPPTELRTRSLYFTIPSRVEEEVRRHRTSGDTFEGAIHAVEHAMISLFPLEFLCDRRDIGGLSTPLHEHTGQSTIFIHDAYSGGVGLARGGYEHVESLLRQTGQLLAECPCENGCPACVQSPHCGNANEPLSKRLGIVLVDALLHPEDLPPADEGSNDGTGADTPSP